MTRVTHEPVVKVDRFQWQPLAIIGAGPSYDRDLVQRLMSAGKEVNVFALNHTICELFRHPRHWWVSNDHDRTFGNVNIAKGIKPRIAKYAPWRTITQRLFIPGSFGDHIWFDGHGKRQNPLKFRLPCPDGTHVAWYLGGHERNVQAYGYVRNGHSVLELALEVATLWGFDPIFLFGCDLHLETPETYYADPFRWKETPAKIVRGKLPISRRSIADNRWRWPENIFHVSSYWKDSPFETVSMAEAISRLCL